MQHYQREKIKLIQTPQAFNFKKILKSYTELANKSFFNQDIFKDDLSVLLEYNSDIKTKLFDGDKLNNES